MAAVVKGLRSPSRTLQTSLKMLDIKCHDYTIRKMTNIVGRGQSCFDKKKGLSTAAYVCMFQCCRSGVILSKDQAFLFFWSLTYFHILIPVHCFSGLSHFRWMPPGGLKLQSGCLLINGENWFAFSHTYFVIRCSDHQGNRAVFWFQ